MNDLSIVAYFLDPGFAYMLSADLWDDKQLPSTVEKEQINGHTFWKLEVSPPDYQQSLDYLKLWDEEAAGYILPERIDEFRETGEPTDAFEPIGVLLRSFNSSQTGKKHVKPPSKETVQKLLKRIERAFGPQEAVKMAQTLDEFYSEQDEEEAVEASIVILMHNKWEHSKRCLWGLYETADIKYEVILVDNGSTDEEMRDGLTFFLNESLLKEIPVKLITFSENVGAIRGRNEALPHCKGDYIVFMDNDIVVGTKSWLRKMIDILKDNPSYGAIGPKLIYPNEPHLIQCAGCDVSQDGKVNFRGRGEQRDNEEFSTSREVQCLISACIVFPREVVRRVGKLDMAFHPVQFEDIDYCYRIKEKNYRIFYESSIEMYHFENVTTGGTGSLNYTYLTVKNGKVFKDKWQHIFSKEGGPSAETMIWKDILTVNISEIGQLEIKE